MSQAPTHATFLLNKLVRDDSPQGAAQEGCTLHHHPITGADLEKALLSKMLEEAEEVKLTATPQERMEELGDLLEVLHALAAVWHLCWDDVEKARLHKKGRRGGFEKGIFGTTLDVPLDQETTLTGLRAQKEKYPEIT